MRLWLQEKCTIKVLNTGAGVPVEMHKEHKVYVPELIFGHLLTSSNYNDNEKKVRLGWGGCKHHKRGACFGCTVCLIRAPSIKKEFIPAMG
jgi:DNA gyrase/topoisomerase IV subunit B